MTAHAPDRRPAARVAVDVSKTRMLGSLSQPALSFEYVLSNVSQGGAGILIPEWSSENPVIQVGRRIHTHLPLRFGTEFRDVGEVVHCEEKPDGLFVGVSLVGKVPLQYPVFLEFLGEGELGRFQTTTPEVSRLFHRVVKDAYFLKRGILIYLDHLIPIFGRAASVRRRISGDDAVRHFQETRGLLVASLEVLLRATEITKPPSFDLNDLPAEWDWDEVRRAVTVDFVVEVLASRFKTREVGPYLRSIRLLDHRLYTNFNTLVALRYLA